MKITRILATTLTIVVTVYLLGLLGVAYGLETPKTVLLAAPSVIGALAASTAVTWLIERIARAVL